MDSSFGDRGGLVKPTADGGYDAVAELYDRAFADIRSRRREWAWLAARLAPPRHDRPPRVLEIGCGTGALCRAMAPLCSEVVGVDVSAGMLERARARGDGGGTVSYLAIDGGGGLPFPDGRFDLAVSFLSYRYLDWSVVPAEIARVLRPGGRFLCVDMVARPCPARDWGRALADGLRDRLGAAPEFRRALGELTRHPAWAEMRRRNPMRAWEDWRAHAMTAWGARAETLSVGRSARIEAFAAPPKGGGSAAGAAGFDAAVLDWGIGGCAVFAGLAAALPSARLLYLSDAGRAPYGLQSRRALRRRLAAVCASLAELGCRRLVVACNAMSAAFPERGRMLAGVAVSGMVGAGLAGVAAADPDRRWRRVGLIGGGATIAARQWERGLRRLGYEVAPAVAQPLSALIEAGRQDGPEFRGLVADLAKCLGRIDALVLACTHYPAAAGVFAELFPGVALYDPAAAVTTAAAGELALAAGGRTGPGCRLAMTGGDPAASTRAAAAAFGLDLAFRRWEAGD